MKFKLRTRVVSTMIVSTIEFVFLMTAIGLYLSSSKGENDRYLSLGLFGMFIMTFLMKIAMAYPLLFIKDKSVYLKITLYLIVINIVYIVLMLVYLLNNKDKEEKFLIKKEKKEIKNG